MYKLRNFSEEIIDKLLDKILKEYDTMCKCDKCIMDIKAYALNSVKPKYIVSEQGEIYTRALNEIDKQEMINITNSIIKAIEVVRKNPKHY